MNELTDKVKFGNYTIEIIDSGLQVNLIVSDKEGYLCTLEPGEFGFELSKRDESLGIEIDHQLIAEISNFIVHRDA